MNERLLMADTFYFIFFRLAPCTDRRKTIYLLTTSEQRKPDEIFSVTGNIAER